MMSIPMILLAGEIALLLVHTSEEPIIANWNLLELKETII